MTRTITVTQTEPRAMVCYATEGDVTLERHLRLVLNVLPGLAFSQSETKELAKRLQEQGHFVTGNRTVVLTEHIEWTDDDPFREFVQAVANLDDGPDTDTCERLQELILWAQDLVKKEDAPDVTLTLRIENTYELHEDEVTTPTITVPAPPPDEDSDDYDAWKNLHILQATGVGHEDGDSWYDVEVTASTRPDLIPVGKTWDFGY